MNNFMGYRSPQELIQRMMSDNRAMQNPLFKNAMDMMQRNDGAGLEQMARNLCKEKGIDARKTVYAIIAIIY